MSDKKVNQTAMDAAKEKAREWNLLDPPTHISADAVRDILEAAYPAIRAQVVQEVADWLEGGAHVAAKWVRHDFESETR
jgi:hypothetical protein